MPSSVPLRPGDADIIARRVMARLMDLRRSQAWLATAAGLDTSSISRLCRAQRLPSPHALVAIATALELPLAQLVADTGADRLGMAGAQSAEGMRLQSDLVDLRDEVRQLRREVAAERAATQAARQATEQLALVLERVLKAFRPALPAEEGRPHVD